jgi:hypothetical protein
MNKPSAPIGLLADAHHLCTLLESGIDIITTSRDRAAIAEATKSLRASIRLHEGEGPSASQEDRQRVAALHAAAVGGELELKADERRLEEAAPRDGYVTGCFVRAKTAKGWESVDMWCLTRESLLAWIETRGPVGPFAKSVILILAGYRPEGPAMGGGPDT